MAWTVWVGILQAAYNVSTQEKKKSKVNGWAYNRRDGLGLAILHIDRWRLHIELYVHMRGAIQKLETRAIICRSEKKTRRTLIETNNRRGSRTKNKNKNSTPMSCPRPHPLLHFCDLGGLELFEVVASVWVFIPTMANEIGPRGIVWESLNGSLDVTPAVGGRCRFLPSGSIEQRRKKNSDGRGKQENNSQTHLTNQGTIFVTIKDVYVVDPELERFVHSGG